MCECICVTFVLSLFFVCFFFFLLDSKERQKEDVELNGWGDREEMRKGKPQSGCILGKDYFKLEVIRT